MSDSKASRKGKDDATVMHRLVEASRTEFFTGPASLPYARIEVAGHWEVHRISSDAFRYWLMDKFCRASGRVPRADAVTQAVEMSAANARLTGETRPLYTRVGEQEGRVYLDLCDERWRAVEIGPDGWRVVDKPSVMFRRGRSMQLLPEPEPVGEQGWAALRELMPSGLSDDDWVLVVSWLVGTIAYGAPLPVLALIGPQESGKGCLARILRRLVDPNVSDLNAKPRNEEDLQIAATNAWVVAIDNISHLSLEQQDWLCRLATGAGYRKRMLYTDDGEYVITGNRPICVNGIPAFVTRPDLLDRCVVVSLSKVVAGLPERVLWERFAARRPAILGAICSAVAAGLRCQAGVSWEGLPRMRDWARRIIAAESAMPWTAGRFLAAYEKNRVEARQLVVEGAPLIEAIDGLLTPYRSDREMTAAEWLEKVRGRVDESVRRQPDFPATSAQFTNELRRLVDLLGDRGLGVTFRKSGERLIRIVRERRSTPDG